jgi:hypothetical protein
MKDIFVFVFTILLLLVVVSGVAWIVQGNDFFMYKYFAPKYEDARRQVFEGSKAYKEGMNQELQNMMFEYVRAGTEHKAALRTIILHRAADFDVSKMSSDLRGFIEKLRNENIGGPSEKAY